MRGIVHQMAGHVGEAPDHHVTLICPPGVHWVSHGDFGYQPYRNPDNPRQSLIDVDPAAVDHLIATGGCRLLA